MEQRSARTERHAGTQPKNAQSFGIPCPTEPIAPSRPPSDVCPSSSTQQGQEGKTRAHQSQAGRVRDGCCGWHTDESRRGEEPMNTRACAVPEPSHDGVVSVEPVGRRAAGREWIIDDSEGAALVQKSMTAGAVGE